MILLDFDSRSSGSWSLMIHKSVLRSSFDDAEYNVLKFSTSGSLFLTRDGTISIVPRLYFI